MSNDIQDKLTSLLEQLGCDLNVQIIQSPDYKCPSEINIIGFTEAFCSDEWEYIEIISFLRERGYERLKNDGRFFTN